MSVDVLDPGAQLPPQVCQALFKNRREPLVIKGQLNSWTKSRFWTPDEICRHLGSKTTTFKISPKRTSPIFQKRFGEKEVIFETQCDYVETTFNNFFEWLACSSSTPGSGDDESDIKPSLCKRVKLDPSQSGGSSTDDGASSLSVTTSVSSTDSAPELPSRQTRNPLMNYPKSDYWIYADYKYMMHLCKDMPDVLSSVDWSVIGFDARDGKDSTLWIGSEGAHTPCHFDTYGCNFVAQLFGKKKWVLFDPQDSDKLYPTRVPYEESSVFCRVNITDPDMTKYPLFNKATAYEVTLESGDLLYVPRHWWHYVESVGEDPTVSINTWVELPEDSHERVKEAVVRSVVSAFAQDEDETSPQWINPNEILFSSAENMLLLSRVLKEYRLQHNQTGSESSIFKNLTVMDFACILTSRKVVEAVTETLLL